MTTADATAVKETPVEIFRKDYKPYGFEIASFYLDFALGEGTTLVSTKMEVKPAGGDVCPMVLDGSEEYCPLQSISINGKKLEASEYTINKAKETLTITAPPTEPFTLEVVCETAPEKNTLLDGLYKSSGNFCTQCEPNGFRNITYFPDRPDVMTIYTTRITGDKAKYPVLLGNGNLVDSGELEGGKHFAVWEDPWKKPCYLFALVAGNLANIEDSFTTMSGRKVKLMIYTEAHNVTKCEHAMKSLIASMKWDEEVYGLEYDLDLFNIVAVDDFNMGAMENKSLNVFNSRLVLASPKTATDSDYSAIEGVVGHEYFHNWTGNRVTCQDWFQLSLKEGLTVFRDQEFSSDLNNRGVKRISDVSRLRTAQFAEDSSPMAHPVRPESYIKMDNFYTVTVYEKGAEVVRMYQTLLGKDGFRKGMDLYFQRHDGAAVQCDDFLKAMEDANSVDLGSFRLWYSQAGTPNVDVTTTYDAAAKTFTVACKQTMKPTPGQAEKAPMVVPIAIGLLGSDGKDMDLTIDGAAAGTTTVLKMDQAEQTFVFTGVAEKPIPSLLRNFSAPVKLTANQTTEDLIFLLANDSDEFNRWEAGQRLLKELLLSLYATSVAGGELVMDTRVVEAFRKVLTDASLDKAFVTAAMSVPGQSELVELLEEANPDNVHAVREFVVKSLSTALKSELQAALAANTAAVYANDPPSRAERSLKNTALGYLTKLGEAEQTKDAVARFANADNMTDQIASLSAVAGLDCPERKECIEQFYQEWKEDPLVLNKWLGLQAMSNIPGNLANVKALTEHPAFDIKNPNKCYSLLGGFCASTVNFHNKDGSGYEFLADMVIKLDSINAGVAARMVKPFARWRKFDPARQALMKAQLSRVLAKEGLSGNVYEIVSKSLE